jgi:hypothetical protein
MNPATAVDLPSASGASRANIQPGDRLSTAGSEFLKAKLASEPEIRPEVVERGRALAADPSYPSHEIISSLASKILQAPDLSEDLS